MRTILWQLQNILLEMVGTFKGIDKGDTRINESGLKNIHGVPYYAAINACVQSIIFSFNSWNGKKIAWAMSIF